MEGFDSSVEVTGSFDQAGQRRSILLARFSIERALRSLPMSRISEAKLATTIEKV